MSRILVRKSDILKYGDNDQEAMRGFGGSKKKDDGSPKAGDSLTTYMQFYRNNFDARLAYDKDLREAQANPKSTAVPVPEPTFQPGELTPEELIQQAREQQEEERQAARAEKVAGMDEEEKMKFLGEELAERTDESAKQKVKDQLMNQALTGGKTFDPKTGKEISLEKLIQQAGLSEDDRKEIMSQADVSFDDMTRPAPTEAEAQPSAPMQPDSDAESVAVPPGFKHGLGARARKVLTENGRLKRVIVENEEGGVQDAGISHNMLVQDPSGTNDFFRSGKGPRDTIPMSKLLTRYINADPDRAAQLFGYDRLIERKGITTEEDKNERMQMQIGMALHAMREDPNVLAHLINSQGLAVTDKSIPTTPEEALAQVKRNFPQVTVPSQQEQLAVEMMREHYPDAIPEGNPTLAAAFGTIEQRGDEDDFVAQDLTPRIRQLQEDIEAETNSFGSTASSRRMQEQLRELMRQASSPTLGMSAEKLQELTVGQGEKVDVQGVVQRKPDSETESSRLDQRILNTFGADKAQAKPKEFERFKNFAMDRLDAIDLADDRARREFAEREEKRFEEQGGYGAGAQRPLMTQDKADEMFGTPASQFGFGTERTDDSIEDALQSAMMIHQRTEAERPDDLTGIVQSEYDKTVEEAMQARAGLEGSVNIDEARSTAQQKREAVKVQRERIAEEGEKTAQYRQRGRKNPVQERMEADLQRLIQERNTAELSLQAIIEGKSGARRAAGTPAPTAGLAGLARDFQQGNVVDMENAPSELRAGAKRGGFDPNAPIQGLPSQARGAVMPVTDEQSAEARAFDSTLDRVGAVQPDEKIRRLNERGQRRDEKYEAKTPRIDFTQELTQGQSPPPPPPPEPETDEERIARLINEAMNPTGGDDNVETGFPMSLGTQLLKGIQHDLYYKGV